MIHFYDRMKMVYTSCKELPNWVETTDDEAKVTCPKCEEHLSGQKEEMMQFRQWEQVLRNEKTQTRRLVEEGDYTWMNPLVFPPKITEVCSSDRTRWTVGKTYAVQPGRGQPAIWWKPDGTPTDTPLDEYLRKSGSVRETWGPKVKNWLRKHGYREARIRLTEIRRERVQDISLEGVFAEGIGIMVDGRLYPVTVLDVAQEEFASLWNSIYVGAEFEFSTNPEVWALTFEVVDEQA